MQLTMNMNSTEEPMHIVVSLYLSVSLGFIVFSLSAGSFSMTYLWALIAAIAMAAKMTFYTGYKAHILFTGWYTTSWQGMLGSCFAVLAMSVVYEGLKAARHWLRYAAVRHSRNVQDNSGSETPVDDAQLIISSPVWLTGRRLYWLHHLMQTLLHFLQFALGFLLMLIAMTFSVWLFLSVILGTSLGYFIFNYKESLYIEIPEDACH